MTIEEAIKLLHPDTTGEGIMELEYYGGFEAKEKVIKAIEEACILACEALEKQIPKKPYDVDERKLNSFYYLDFRCPSCNKAIVGQRYRPNYCKHCGQALNWSEVEE